jgi:hypothetical protein
MKPIATNHEILLFKGTSFSNPEFSKPGKFDSRVEPKTLPDEFGKASWAGVHFEILPGLTTHPLASCKMYIRNIHSAAHFLQIIQGTDPHPFENSISIGPAVYLKDANFN